MMKWSEPPLPRDGGPPTIKNHSVTYHEGLLYCFGGYDGRRNHMTLMVYGLGEKRWRGVSPIGNAVPPIVAGGGGVGGSVHGVHAAAGGAADETDGAGVVPVGPHPVLEQGLQPPPAPGGGAGAAPAAMGGGGYYVSGTPPPGRNGHTATLATSGPSGENARIVIIGGWLGTGPLAASDLHVLDVSGGVESLRWYQPTIKGTPPGPCNMHSADFISKKNEIYVFRGGNGREYLNDLHALDVTTYKWRQVETTGEAPQQRANHSSAVLDETSELFIFGGWNGRERLNDIHILDTDTGTWSRPHVGGDLPYPRAGMTLTALRGRLYLFGGSGTSSKCFNDLQILDRKEMAWLNVMQKKESQITQTKVDVMNGGSSASSGAVDSSGRRHATDWRTQEMDRHSAVLAATGTVRSANPNDEDDVPTIFVHGHGPGRRAGHTATAVDRNIYVFGGSCGSDYLNDFFVLDTDPCPPICVSEPTSLQLFERRLRHFYNDEEFSDVTFVVEGRQVYGHKLVLSLVSDCFRAMFTTKYGTGTGFREASSECSDIEIPNCSYLSFVTMMEYIYTGQAPEIDILGTTAGGDDRGIERVVDLLELADQFFLEHLKQICERMLQPAVNADSVEYFLQVSQKANASQLAAVCRHFERNRDS